MCIVNERINDGNLKRLCSWIYYSVVLTAAFIRLGVFSVAVKAVASLRNLFEFPSLLGSGAVEKGP